MSRALVAEMDAWLAERCGACKPAWQWTQQPAGVDLFAPLFDCRLKAAASRALVEDFHARFGGSATAAYKGGYLNVTLDPARWWGLMSDLEADADWRRSYLGLALWDGAAERGREAERARLSGLRVLGEWAGWPLGDGGRHVPSPEEARALRGMLAAAGDPPRMWKALLDGRDLLWQVPVLWPADPHGSAWRQRLLRLMAQVSDALSAPS